MMLKLLRIVGARPQFMQAKPLRQELENRGHKEIMLHTGQHYDDAMSKQFFSELELPQADINLGVGSASHGKQTGDMLQKIEAYLLQEKYHAVVVDGDTNSTLAGALAASKLHVPVVHVESGMRSFDKRMPEEINRIMTDHVSYLLFCPSDVSKTNLNKEGLDKNIYVVGDLLAQCFVEFQAKAKDRILRNLKAYGLEENKFILLTLHRAENVDDPEKLKWYLNEIQHSPMPVLWPIHPRTNKQLEKFGLTHIIQQKPFLVIEPVGYLDMLALEGASAKILTDSGGVQREAFHWKKTSAILRDTTEWTELTDSGWATLHPAGKTSDGLLSIPDTSKLPQKEYYGSRNVAKSIVDIMEAELQ